MTFSARKRLTAWLGIFAMWLAVAMPVMSQALEHAERASDPAAALCTVDALQGHAKSSMADHMDACGYCSVLAHHPPVAPSAVVASTTTWIAHTRTVALSTGILPTATFPSGRPRGPPVFA